MKLISPLIKILNQLKVYHWQTTSYAEHKAFGKAYDELNDLIDSFVEIYMGKHGQPMTKVVYKFELESYSEDYRGFVNDCVQYFTNLGMELTESDTDLNNIKDEMLAEINKLKYLLSLQ